MAMAAKILVQNDNITNSNPNDVLSNDAVTNDNGAAKPNAPATHGMVMHEAPLTAEEFAFLNSLEEVVGAPERVRVDLAELLMDEETVRALQRYRLFFETGGVDVDAALEALPKAIRLYRLKRRLELAQALVQRHLTATCEPVVGITSGVQRMVAGTPEGSALRAAFALFRKKWQDTFRGGRSASEPETSPAPANDTPAKPR